MEGAGQLPPSRSQSVTKEEALLSITGVVAGAPSSSIDPGGPPPDDCGPGGQAAEAEVRGERSLGGAGREGGENPLTDPEAPHSDGSCPD